MWLKTKISKFYGFHHTVWSHHRSQRPDIVVIDKVKKETMIIDVAMPEDKRVCDKEGEKILE